MLKYGLLILSIILTPNYFAYASSDLDSISFATYYPAPYGVYNEMRLYPHTPSTTACDSTQEGLMYYKKDDITFNGQLMVCKQTDATTFSWQSAVPSGAIMPFNLTACPSGWIPANGNNGTPDLRGVFIRGLDNGRGLDTGRTLGSYQADDFKAHQHTFWGFVYNNDIDGVDSYTTNSFENHYETINTAFAGGTETRPKNVAFTYCIKQ